jgi:hypothetical protein
MTGTFNKLARFLYFLSLQSKDSIWYFTGSSSVSATELFDPEDESLKLIIVDRNQFPRTQNITYKIKILRELGLKSTSRNK